MSPKTFQIESKNPAHLKALLRALYAMGYKYGGKDTPEEAFEYYRAYPWLFIKSPTKYIGGNTKQTSYPKVITSLEEIFAENVITVDLANNNRAQVRETGVLFKSDVRALLFDELNKLIEAKSQL